MSTSDPRAGELVLAGLYLQATPEREERLRRAARALPAWDAALVALEAHGVLGLALRNLERAAAVVPSTALEALRARTAAMVALEVAFRLTLERFVAAAAAGGIEVLLLKGSSLALDLYPEPGLRAQGDLDLLVRARDVKAALAAAERIGLLPPPAAFPAWWYRLAHFHLKLVPRDGLQRELELHWHLHPEERLYGVSVEALFARSRPVEIAGAKAFTLDPLDRLLHLVTHLLRHAELGAAHEEALARWAVDAHAPVRLKWPLDIVSEIERRHAELEPRLLAARALEWNAAADLALGLGWIEQRLALTAPARAWVRSVLAPLPTPAPGSARSAARARERPLAGLDLRLSLLRSLPRWIWPEKSRFARRPDGRVPLLARLRHALTVGARVLALSFALPFAWLTRLARSVRPRALAPDELLELAVQARELERRGGSRAPSP